MNICERGECARQIEPAHHHAIARFVPPDRDHHRFGNAGLVLDPLQTRALRLIRAAPPGDDRRADVLRFIRREGRNTRIRIRRTPAGLRTVQFDDAGVQRQRRQDHIKRSSTHSLRDRLRAKLGKIRLETGLILRRGTPASERAHQCGRRDGHPTHHLESHLHRATLPHRSTRMNPRRSHRLHKAAQPD
jgi:hypothetical protein